MRETPIKIRIAAACAASLITAATPSVRADKNSFSPIAPKSVSLYKIDLARHFFASPDAEKADRAKLNALYRELEKFRGRLGDSAGDLLKALHLYEQATIAYTRHENYLFLRAALDTEERKSIDADDAVIAAYDSRTAFVRQELADMGDAALREFIKQRPALAPYEFAIKSARRFHDHQLPLAEEELLQAQTPSTIGWQYDLYEQLIGGTDFSAVKTAQGFLDARRQRAAIANNPDAAVRRTGFQKLYAGFASKRDLYAFDLRNLARARNQRAKLHHFDDDAEASYFNSYWSKAEVSGVLSSISEKAEVYKDYERARAKQAARQRKLNDVNVWDVSGSLSGVEAPRFTIGEASKTLNEAVSPLGVGFRSEMAALLDPNNGRLDIAPGEHRKSGGFSLGFIGVDSVFFTGGYQGAYNDMRVLAHEATHAVHRQLMSQHGVSPLYAAGPSYLFESFAAFSELLLADHLYKTAQDPRRKLYYLEQFLEGKGSIMFVAAPEAVLEQSVYEADAKGESLDADALDALTLATYSRYSIWPEKNTELKSRWMMITLMYEDPFYDLNYVYAGLLALVYYDLYEQDREGFSKKYEALMENGFDAEPTDLLKKTIGIDLADSDALVAHAMNVLREKVGEYTAMDKHILSAAVH